MSTKITAEGQRCRKCGTRLVRRPGGNKIKPNQTYYFKTYLFCPGCKAIYHSETQKVFIKHEPPKQCQSTVLNRWFRKEIMEIFRGIPGMAKEVKGAQIIEYAKTLNQRSTT